MDFDFGPISRTETGGRKDSFNLTPIPLHEAMDALMAANDRDEFVAWLWHDVFKPLFWFIQKPNGELQWTHIANNRASDPLARESEWAGKTQIPSGLVSSHHYRSGRQLTYSEKEITSDQFDQVGLGRETRFLQLAFVVESATNTILLRAVIANAFMEIVTKMVADTLWQQLCTRQPAFEQVRYVFEFSQVHLSTHPTDAEVKTLADRYDVKVKDNELLISHFTPVRSSYFDGRRVEMAIDLTATHPTPERFKADVFSLVELLTVYQDSCTILMSIPQFLSVDVQQLKQEVQAKATQYLQAMDVLTTIPEAKLKKQVRTINKVDWTKLSLIRQGPNVDLLAHGLNEQVAIRLIDSTSLPLQAYQDDRGRTFQARLLNKIAAWPVEQLRTKSRHCRICGSAFDSVLPAGVTTTAKTFSPDFTDAQHIGFSGDICPMCRIYALNSHQFTQAEKARGSTGMRKAYRGAFALLMPSSHFTYRDEQGTLLEQPPLDVGGRFSGALQRATFTSQEFVLFNVLSRRIIGEIWQRLNDGDGTHPLPLPYLGAILLTQDKAQDVRRLFDHLEVLFCNVELRVYPFKATIQPAVELAFEMAINDLQKHHTKHTYLKSNPITVTVSPESKFMLLVDNGLQLEVSHQFFADQKRIETLLSGIKGLERRRNWLLAVLGGNDPATATAEAFYDQATFWHAENTFWATQMGRGSPAKQWQAYEEVQKEIKQIVSRYPLLIEFFANPRR
jgi:hypothetical protein